MTRAQARKLADRNKDSSVDMVRIDIRPDQPNVVSTHRYQTDRFCRTTIY